MNTRKPTKKEVPDDVHCWYWYQWSWRLVYGSGVRFAWVSGDRWLPYNAIPDPSQKPTPRSKP